MAKACTEAPAPVKPHTLSSAFILALSSSLKMTYSDMLHMTMLCTMNTHCMFHFTVVFLSKLR